METGDAEQSFREYDPSNVVEEDGGVTDSHEEGEDEKKRIIDVDDVSDPAKEPLVNPVSTNYNPLGIGRYHDLADQFESIQDKLKGFRDKDFIEEVRDSWTTQICNIIFNTCCCLPTPIILGICGFVLIGFSIGNGVRNYDNCYMSTLQYLVILLSVVHIIGISFFCVDSFVSFLKIFFSKKTLRKWGKQILLFSFVSFSLLYAVYFVFSASAFTIGVQCDLPNKATGFEKKIIVYYLVYIIFSFVSGILGLMWGCVGVCYWFITNDLWSSQEPNEKGYMKVRDNESENPEVLFF